jgi:hypothetical protein
MKSKNLIVLLIIGLVLFSCKNDDDNSDDFDAAAQAIEDNVLLIDYLKTHYLNEEDGGIWTITNNEPSLMDDVRLKTEDVTYNDVVYKLYSLVKNEGSTISPSGVDSIYFTYTGMLLDSTVFDSKSIFSWNLGSGPALLDGLIPGWQYGFRNFKGGTVVQNDDESFDFEDYGEGILFIPSGLAYGNSSSSTGVIPSNSPLIFEIALKSVNLVDHDSDTVDSKYEDLNGDNIFTNDDTDGDGIPNYYDDDDDGDGVLTKDEDANGDGDPRNDDSNGNGIPDYLDKDTF